MTAIAVRSAGLKLHGKENSMPGKDDAKEMPEGFAPSEFDVLVGWARQNFHHAGNRRFRDVITEHVPSYLKADSKVSRGQIISDIVKQMQRNSPSGTGFLKLNPYTAKWSFIGTEKAKDKVGHALRKALMNNQDDSAEESYNESQDGHNQNDETKSTSNKRKTTGGARGEAAPAVLSALRKAKRKVSATAAPVSILKRTGASAISSKAPRYLPGRLTLDTVASGASPTEADLTTLSKLFATSPAAPGTLRQHGPPSTSDHTTGVLLSPVARDMFDEKNHDGEGPDSSPSSARHRKRGVLGSRSAKSGGMDFHHSSPMSSSFHHNGDDEDHPHDTLGDSAYPEQRAMMPSHYHQRQHLGVSSMPPMAFPPPHPPIYGSAPSTYVPPYYFPAVGEQHSSPPVLLQHPLPPPPPHLSGPPPSQSHFMLSPRRRGAASSHPAPPHVQFAQQEENGLAAPHHHQHPPVGVTASPPPPSNIYFPPGFYYYPGFAMPGAPAPGGAPMHHYPPPPFFPGPPPGAEHYPAPHHHHHHPHPHGEEEADERNVAVPGTPLDSEELSSSPRS